MCAGETVAESNVPASAGLRVEIAQKIQEGQTDDEIRRSIAARYGEEVLLTPSASGINALVWLLPVVAFAMAVGFLVLVFRRWNQESTIHATAADEALVADALRREREPDADDTHGEGSSR